MPLGKLHTRQYKLLTATATVCLAAWFGSGIAHADTNREREACALMDDHSSAMINGYSSYAGQYAFVVLSHEMPPLDAAHVLRAATIDVCPNHAGDLPVDWQ